MAEQRQRFKTISPQLVVGALPQRISTVDFYVRGLIIESADGNKGKLFIADSEAKATTTNRHVLYSPGDSMPFDSDPWGNLDAQINLKEIWLHGEKTGDKFVVSYLEIIEALK
jgi:hypothetical protein